MERREKERLVFIKLVNKQLEPFNVTYEEVKQNPDWYMEYRTNEESEKEFMKWGVDLISKELGVSKKSAQMEMNWFILQWGLTTAVSDSIKQKVAKITKTTKKA